MKSFAGKTLRWNWNDGVVELTLDREPANEIGTAMLGGFGKICRRVRCLAPETSVCIISSARKHGFSAGADLRELYEGAAPLDGAERLAGVRKFLERIHAVLNAIDAAPFVTIAAVHGICFGGGLELALACDIIVADKMARFAFPELRLGLIPGFGGIPRLKRDLGNAFRARFAVHRAQRKRYARAGRWTGIATCRGRRSVERGAFERQRRSKNLTLSPAPPQKNS